MGACERLRKCTTCGNDGASYPPARPVEMVARDSQKHLPPLSAKSGMVARALQMHPAMACAAQSSIDHAGQAALIGSSAEDKSSLFRDYDSNYDTAEEMDESEDERADGYVSADECTFRKAARCHSLCGRGITPTGPKRKRKAGLMLATICAPQLLNQAMRGLHEERPVHSAQSSGIVSVQGHGAAHLTQDVNHALELLGSLKVEEACEEAKKRSDAKELITTSLDSDGEGMDVEELITTSWGCGWDSDGQGPSDQSQSMVGEKAIV